MNKKIQSQVLKEINAESRRELKKWINEGGRIDEYVLEKYGSHVKKAISRTIELMEEQNNHLHSTLHCKLCKSMSVSRIDEQKADFRKMIESCETFSTKANWIKKKELLTKLGDDKEIKK